MTTLTGHLAGDGITADVTITVQAAAPEPPEPPMAVGLTCHYTDFGTHLNPGGTFAGAAFCRTFAQPGQGLYPQPPAKTVIPAQTADWRSFKDMPSAADLNQLLDGLQVPMWLTYRHEHDNGKSSIEQSKVARADLFARWRDIYDIIDAHPNRALVTVMPIQTLQWTTATTGPDRIKGDNDWRTWWPGVGDGMGWDCYVDSWAPRYPDVEEFFRLPFEAAAGVGRPLWVPELGSVRLAGDTTGAGRAAWIADAVAYLRERDCYGVAWWCALGTNDRDFHLSDQPSADAWRTAIGG